MVVDERGSESVQFSFAAVLLIVVAFGIMQAAMMNAAAIMLSSELTQACMRIDVSGLRTASDKESFVAEQILDESAQLRRSDLTVSGCGWNRTRARMRFPQAASQAARPSPPFPTTCPIRRRYRCPGFAMAGGCRVTSRARWSTSG